MAEITFSEDAKHIITLVKDSDENLFVTGKAGTGKSTLLSHISEQDPSIIVLAPTGIAAINVQGETIHSFFKLKPGYELDEASHMPITKDMEAQYDKVHTVIIDEISMVRADILDAIDEFLRRVRKSAEPFGGVRMIFFGDLFQLPPVLVRDEREAFLQKYANEYFFSAEVFKPKDLFTPAFVLRQCHLQTIYRQKDPEFTALLNGIRTNTLDAAGLQRLNQQVRKHPRKDADEFQIKLVATNKLAQKINHENLKRVEGEAMRFAAANTGDVENLQPNDAEVALKPGAQVMFINNDFDKRWANGTIGKVRKFGETEDDDTGETIPYVLVELENGETVKVKPHTWDISKYKFKEGEFVREEIGTFTQIPLKLAWAITIHKSQGKTFSRVRIDLGYGSFAHGQTYVALSRCKTLQNIELASPLKLSDIIVDDVVLDYVRKGS